MNAMPSNYKKGTYHMHTIFSDGAGTVKDLADAARNNKIDFAILTDHGEPNMPSAQATTWYDEILIIGGSELSLECGHLATAGFQIPKNRFPTEPQMAIDELNRAPGAVTFVAHPYDTRIPWTDWNISNFTGIELANVYSFAIAEGASSFLTFPVQYLFNSDYALLSLLNYPQKNIDKWNQLNKKGHAVGIFALDVHGHLQVTKTFSLHFPSYNSMFRLFNLYVKIDSELQQSPQLSSEIILKSIKKGKFFNTVEALAPANGFDTYFIHKNGEISEMGSQSENFEGEILLKIPFNFKTHIRVFRNSEIFKEFKDNYETSMKIPVKTPGVYRTEIYYEDFQHFPWIVTNPFFLRKKESVTLKADTIDLSNLKQTVIPIQQLKLEKNSSSKGSIKSNPVEVQLSAKLISSEDKNFWVSASLRKEMNCSDVLGIKFQIKASEHTHLWFELRTRKGDKDLWFKKSLISTPQWSEIFIPFEKLRSMKGDSKPNLDKVYAFFISMNNTTSFPNTEREIFIRNIRLIHNEK